MQLIDRKCPLLCVTLQGHGGPSEVICWVSITFFLVVVMLVTSITDAELQIEGYSFHRGDRKFNLHTEVINEDISKGGGSIIYFRNHINAQRN